MQGGLMESIKSQANGQPRLMSSSFSSHDRHNMSLKVQIRHRPIIPTLNILSHPPVPVRQL